MAHRADIQSQSSQLLLERKKQLLAEGAVYRASIVIATHSLKSGLHFDVLARGAANQLLHFISPKAGFSMRSLRDVGAGNFSSAVPLLIGGISFLKKHHWLSPALKVVAVIGACGAVLTIINARNTKHRANQIID